MNCRHWPTAFAGWENSMSVKERSFVSGRHGTLLRGHVAPVVRVGIEGVPV